MPHTAAKGLAMRLLVPKVILAGIGEVREVTFLKPGSERVVPVTPPKPQQTHCTACLDRLGKKYHHLSPSMPGMLACRGTKHKTR
jgi:hypothetical protein